MITYRMSVNPIPSPSKAEISLVSNLKSPWIPGRTRCPRKCHPLPCMKAVTQEGKTHPEAKVTTSREPLVPSNSKVKVYLLPCKTRTGRTYLD